MCSQVSRLGWKTGLLLHLLGLPVCSLLTVLGAPLETPVEWSKQGFLPLCSYQLHCQGCLECWDRLERWESSERSLKSGKVSQVLERRGRWE